MRVVIFTDTYEPYVSGVVTSIKMLKTALEKMKHEVFIVTANLKSNKFIYDEDNKIIYIPGVKTGIYDAKLTSFYSHKAFKIIKSWNIDIIHSQSEFGIGFFSRIVAKRLKKPVVHTYHTLYEDYVYYVTHGHFDNLAKKLVIKLTKYYCGKSCESVIVPTEKIKNLFANKYNITKNVYVVPTGIDLSRFETDYDTGYIKKKYNILKDDIIIGAVGRVALEKSFDEMLLASKELIENNDHIKLMIVGDGPDIDNLRDLTKALKIDDNVIFTGKVPYDEVPGFYQTFNFLTSFSRTETQGLTIIEGLASGLPTLCIKDDSFIDSVEPGYNGYLFTSNKEFQEKILYLIDNKDEYEKMANNAKNSAHKYSKEVFADAALKIYHKCLEASKKNRN